MKVVRLPGSMPDSLGVEPDVGGDTISKLLASGPESKISISPVGLLPVLATVIDAVVLIL